MIRVFFVNGEQVEVTNAVAVRPLAFAGTGLGGISLVDANGKEVSQFQVTHLVGYWIAPEGEAT